jgi:dihydroorotate dehydrogenase electron transfer subunit
MDAQACGGGIARVCASADRESRPRPTICTAEVISNSHVAGDYYELAFAAPRIAKDARGGQFVMVQCGEAGSFDPLLKRPMSIEWAEPREGIIYLLVRIVGKASRLLCAKQPGDSVEMIGPLGTSFERVERPGKHVLVGAGAGVAPLLLFSRELDPAQVWAIVAATEKDLLLCCDRFAGLGIETDCSTDDGSFGFAGFASDLLAKRLEDGTLGAVAGVCLCGPPEMIQEAAGICARKALPCQVSMEAYMACGFGVCLGCVVTSKTGERLRCCVDGPVFGAELFEW